MRDDVNIDREASDEPESASAAGRQAELDPATDARSDDASGSTGSGDGAAETADETQRTLQELRDKHLRLAAEFDNYRRRSVRERQEAGSRAQAELAKQIVDSLDDLARVTAMDPEMADVSSVVKGVDLVEKKLLKALSSAGLEVINPVDQTFDPSRHEAVATEPALAREDDHTISRVFQPGYMFNGQLLRPARVVVKQWDG